MLALLLALVACDSALDDVDNDMLNASEEAAVGTHVERPDSDDDGLLDGFEVFCSLTDPADPDQDADGDDDGWEHLRGLDPTNAEDAGYADGRDMLPIADKLALRPDRAPPIAAPDLPLRRLALGHPTLLRPFDLYDLALQDKWILLTLVPPTDVEAMNTWLTGGAPPDWCPRRRPRARRRGRHHPRLGRLRGRPARPCHRRRSGRRRATRHRGQAPRPRPRRQRLRAVGTRRPTHPPTLAPPQPVHARPRHRQLAGHRRHPADHPVTTNG
jgi:hypothetical protein